MQKLKTKEMLEKLELVLKGCVSESALNGDHGLAVKAVGTERRSRACHQ